MKLSQINSNYFYGKLTKLNCYTTIRTVKTLYLQIKNQIKAQIISGQLVIGEQLPSIRFLAKELRISMLTAKRAFDELEMDGFINSVQGKGNFVAPQNKELIREEYLKKIESMLQKIS